MATSGGEAYSAALGIGSTGVTAKTEDYAPLTTDNGRTITFDGSSLTVTFTDAPAVAWFCVLVNLNASALTVTPSGPALLNGSADSLTLSQNEGAFVWSDGTNLFYGLLGGGGGGGGAGTPVVRAFPFAFDDVGLDTGETLYTPTPGDILLDAWIEIDTAWDGTTPLGDYGNIWDISGEGFCTLISNLALDMTQSDDGAPSILFGNLVSGFRSLNDLSTVVQSVTSNVGGGPLIPPTSLAGSRYAPAKLLTDDPFQVVVSQDGTNTGGDPGSTQGSATLYLVTATPL